MTGPRALRVAVAAGAALALAATGAGSAGTARLPAGAVGCHPSWPVSAYDGAGRAVVQSQQYVPCVTTTGYATSETSIGVTDSGAIFFSPAHTENTMAISHDHGASWGLTAPPTMEYTSLWNTVDPQIAVDHRTGRLFWVHVTGPTRTLPVVVDESPLPPPTGSSVATTVAFAYGFQVYSTADDGRTWTTADDRTAPITDWEKITVGPARPAGSGAPQPHGYPDVVYVCGNSPAEVVGPGRLCFRSLDGGASFAPAGYVLPSPAAPKACLALDSDTPSVGGDGTLYVPMTCSDGAYVAVSTDEGATYTWRPVPGTPHGTTGGGGHVQLAVDAADELYAVWLDDGRIQVSMSRDAGRSWTAPQTASPPELHQIVLPAVAAGPAGAFGLVYYGSRSSTPGPLSAYLTQTWTGRDPRPTFVTSALAPPGRPLLYVNGLTSGSPRADYIGAAYDRNGVLWAGLVQQLAPPDATGAIATVGLVAHVVRLARHAVRPRR